uniref:Leucine-rich repeat-containing N-terminal plant-type domain-containing protein n=1 Tax=Brassica campestris TaxID=3711 RepID=M4CQ77_BRACM
MLQHNQFTGQLPPQLASLQRLKQFSVADNHLIGPVPKFNEAYFGSESFANNTDLCGLPMEFCINPEEKVSRFGQMGAAIGAAIFAPVGAFLGWFFFNDANEANVNCLRNIYSGVKDPNGYLASWVFGNQTAGFICKFTGVTCWHDDENRVLSIKLGGYGLEGEFPLGIKQCWDLTGLDLSRNNFSGVLPSNIASLIPSVTILDLSYNKFSGKIPAGLSNITFLNTLMLQHNQFTGQLPPELVSMQRLKQFSVAYNHLTGPIPKFNEEHLKIGVDDFANNEGLCGRPMDACEPDEDMIRFGKMGAAVGAVLFAPLVAYLRLVCHQW